MTFQGPPEGRPAGRHAGPSRGSKARTPPRPAGHTCRVVADRASTGGGYSLTEATSAPGAGVPPHAHDDAVECFYVIEGEYRLTVGGAAHHLLSGDLLLVPRGAPHQFEVVGREPGRALEVFAPAGCGPPEVLGRPAAGGPRPGTIPRGTSVPVSAEVPPVRPEVPRLPGPKAVVFAGANRAARGGGGQPGAGPSPAEETRTTLVVSLRSDLVSGASWRLGPGTTALWVLAGRYRVETDAGPVPLGEGEVLPMEQVGDAVAVAAAPSSRALVLQL